MKLALKHTKRWILAAIGLLLALLILKIVSFLTAKPKITVDYVAEYNRTAHPQDYDPNENAAPYYQKAFDIFVDIPNELQKPYMNWPTDFNESDQNTLSQWLASNEQAFEYFMEASRKPYYWLERKSEKDNTVAGIMLPELSPFRQLTRAMLWDAKVKAAHGQFLSAFENILVRYNAGQHKCRSSLFLVEQHYGLGIKKDTVHSAFFILDNSKVEDEALAFLQNAFQSELNNNDYIPDIQTEKYFLYDALQRTFIDNGKGTGRLAWRTGWYYEMFCSKYNNFIKRLYACFAGPTQNETIGKIEKVLALSCQIMPKTPWQIKNDKHDYFNEIDTINNGNWFLQIFGVNPKSIFYLYHKTRTQTKALIAIIAILRYQIDTGQFPETLDNLVSAGYLNSVPVDPYSGKPLIYRHTEENFTLYSVGDDFKDDGGVIQVVDMASAWPGFPKVPRLHSLDIIYWPVEDLNKQKELLKVEKEAEKQGEATANKPN